MGNELRGIWECMYTGIRSIVRTRRSQRNKRTCADGILYKKKRNKIMHRTNMQICDNIY